MARVLIVEGGGRGRVLAAALAADGHAVRATTRDAAAGAGALMAAGAEPVQADPDRIATLMPALEGVTVLAWLLGDAAGAPDAVAALHTDRLRMLFEKLVDSPVRGVLHEPPVAAGEDLRERSRAVAAHAGRTWSIPIEELDASRPVADWVLDARAAVAKLLTRPAGDR